MAYMYLQTKLNEYVKTKYNVGLKALLQQGISEPIIYGNLVYNSKGSLEGLILLINSKV